MSEKSMPWMVDGKPGQILELMHACMRDIQSVKATTKATRGEDGAPKTTTSTSAQDVVNAVREVLVAYGVVMRVMGSEPEFNNGRYVSMIVTVHFAAPDGSYWPCCAPCGAIAPNMKSAAAALTAGVKSILRHTFMLHIAESDEDMRSSSILSSGLRKWHDTLLGFKTLDELHGCADHPDRLALADHEIAEARIMFRDRQEDLREALSQEKLAYWKAREMQGQDTPESAKPRRAR